MKQNRLKNLAQGQESSGSRIVIAVILILILSNLNAIIDLILHPDIPYFDLEHLIVGGITGSFGLLIFILLFFFLKQIDNTNDKLKILITELKIEKDRVQEREEELFRLNADKDMFISILSHDLKGPFSTLLGFSEVLKEEIQSNEINNSRKN